MAETKSQQQRHQIPGSEPKIQPYQATGVKLTFLLMTFFILNLVSRGDCNNIEFPKDRKISLAGRKYRISAKNEDADTSLNKVSYSRTSQDYTSSQRTATMKNTYSRHPSKIASSGRRPAAAAAARSEKPNIVVILTDDQDVLLGSLKYMPKVQNLLIRQGVYFNNSFVPTPMCCPSRSSFLTGMYVHNHNVYTNNANCSSKEWQQHFEHKTFATYVNETYVTGYFGKYLNEYEGSYTPPGWHRWVGLLKNSRFYNYSVVDEKGVKTKHDDNYYADYLTDLVANDSRAFLHDSKKRNASKPVFMVLSVPAPHGPEDAAPQYQHMFVNNTDHRTPSWNVAPNPDKQWLLRNIYPMMPQHKIFTDLLQRRRLQTLQSVDDLVESVVEELDMLGELDNTYIVYTSDHGYHLGQFGLIKGKSMPFDFDVRVPLIVRGPGVRPGTIISNIVSNVDIAPTLIDMAGEEVPEHMDGESMLKLIRAAKDPSNVDKRGFVETKKLWRDTILLERGKLTEKALKQRMKTEEMIIYSQAATAKGIHFYIPTKKRKLAVECSKDENKLPCKPQQKWYCIEDNGHLRKHKCRHNTNINGGDLVIQKDQASRLEPCQCHNRRLSKKLTKVERRRQRRFLKKHAGYDVRSKSSRHRRSMQNIGAPLDASAAGKGFSRYENMFNRRCRILANESVVCDLDIYQKASEWESHKEKIDDMIREYRKALEDLRDIRRHLREQRPVDASDDYNEEDGEVYAEGSVIGTGSEEECECDEDGNIIDAGRRRKLDSNIQLRKERMEAREKRRQLRRQRRRRKQQEHCNAENMNCFMHDNDHWKTPPYWHYGPFCFCSNANNNTYWCLRTINQTHDFLYCEFITTFMSYYNLKTDPHQLKNTVTELNYGILQQLHEELKKLQKCKTSKDCTLRSGQKNRLPSDPEWAGLIHLRRESMHRKYVDDYIYDDDNDDFYNEDFYDEAVDDETADGFSFDYE